MSKIVEVLHRTINNVEIVWIALFISVVGIVPVYASEPSTPIVQMENELYNQPAKFMTEVEKRYNQLKYNVLDSSYPARVQTLLKLKSLTVRLENVAREPLQEIDWEYLWKKESSVQFLSNLYYWLHNPAKVSTVENGLDDAWYNVSTSIGGFEKSFHWK